jgi:cyanophycinase
MSARLTLLSLAMFLATAGAQGPAAPIDPMGVPGTRILGGGGKLPTGVYERFLELAGGKQGHIVLIPTATAACDTEAEQQAILTRWRTDHPGYEFTLLHTRDRAIADREDFTAPLRAATGVWISGGAQKRIADAYLGTRTERELQALLARGGVIGGTSAGTAIQTRTMIQEGMEDPIVATGFDFVPGAISDQHFLRRKRLPRLLKVLAAHPGHFGIGVDEGTAVEVHGRELRVLGASKALFVLPAAAGRPERVLELAAGDRQDLVTWQRAARDRAGSPWPPMDMLTREPQVAHGSLVIVGGGRLPPAVFDRFVELAGGKNAKVVIVPSAAPASERGPDPIEKALRTRGVEVRELDCATPTEVTAERLAVLADATGIWFGGGRQWRLCDAFEGTPAIAAFHAVLARGGVIGGSSAGATIQGEFLVRGNPLGNTEERCEGYDRGFGFLPGCAIDQHFLARNRTADLQQLITSLPQLIGLGIDEGTAIVVHGSEFEVLGDSKVAVFDYRHSIDLLVESAKVTFDYHPSENPKDPVWLLPGARWDLRTGEKR